MKRLTRRRALLGLGTMLFVPTTPAIIKPSQAGNILYDGLISSAGGCVTAGSGVPLDGLVTTGAWSASRKLYTAFGGSFYSGAAGFTLFDQSGNSQDFTNGGGTTSAACTQSVAGVVFGGSNWLNSPSATYVTATDGYMITTIRPTSFTSDVPVSPYLNAVVLLNSGQNFGITVSNNSGSPLAYAINWGVNNFASNSIVANTIYVVEWRHQSGTVFCRVNGGTETSQASGNTSTSGFMQMGGRVTSNMFVGQIYEAAIFSGSDVPSSGTRDALVQSFGLYAGATV